MFNLRAGCKNIHSLSIDLTFILKCKIKAKKGKCNREGAIEKRSPAHQPAGLMHLGGKCRNLFKNGIKRKNNLFTLEEQCKTVALSKLLLLPLHIIYPID